mgnify:FL=1|jgi:hypothetical protein
MNIKFSLLFPCFLSLSSYAQQVNISASADRSEMKIGEQVCYKITIETDSTAQVIFPDTYQFTPFEVVNEIPIDTFREREKFRLIKEYRLTQFDSGHYTLPPLRIDVNKRAYQTDSLRFVVQDVAIDTLKQPLYEIKPAIEVKKVEKKGYLVYWLLGIIALVAIFFAVYWFFIKKKPKEQKDEIALLPPFDRALLKLKNLQNSRYLIESNHKEYYSVLTDIIRKYLEEEIHISATESTTDELLTKLQVFLDAGKLHLSLDVVNQLRNVLQKADLVKFAKSKPQDFEAEDDRKSIETILVKTNEGIPDSIREAEAISNISQQQSIVLQKKRRKNILIISLVTALLIALIAGTWYAFTIGKDEKINMEDWITSSYGYPPVTITTPTVLKREKVSHQLDRFIYHHSDNPLSIMLIANSLKDYMKDLVLSGQIDSSQEGQEENFVNELVLKMIEKELEKYFNGENILIKEEPYTTTQGVVGHKVFGSFVRKNKQEQERMLYQSYFFIKEENLYMILFAYPEEDKEHSSTLTEKIISTLVIQ